jgi:hypothetical protein
VNEERKSRVHALNGSGNRGSIQVVVPVPRSYEEAMLSNEWRNTTLEELGNLDDHQTFVLEEIDISTKTIDTKWIYEEKMDESGKRLKAKARLVARGFMQVYGEDFTETFAPVASMTTIRMVLALSASQSWHSKAFDITGAFLNGFMDELVYVDLPKGYYEFYPDAKRNAGNGKKLALRAEKGIYGTKQAARQWNKDFDAFMKESGCIASKNDACMYYKREGDELMVIVLHVDDGMVVSSSQEMMDEFMEKLFKKYKGKENQGSYFLKLEVSKGKDYIGIRQKPYIEKKVEEFGLKECNFVTTPMESGFYVDKNQDQGRIVLPYKQIVGSIMYAMTKTRPDVVFAIGMLARYMDTYREAHWKAARRILKYLDTTKEEWLIYKKGNLNLEAYVDADFAQCKETRKSVTGYVVRMCGGAISWRSRKQPVVTLSTMEAEYVAASEVAREIVWIRSMLHELGLTQEEPTTIWEDNNSCIAMANNPDLQDRSKHVDVKYHYVREQVEKNVIKFERVNTKEQVADTLTKALEKKSFEKSKLELGLYLIDRGSVGNEQSSVAEKVVACKKASKATKPQRV